MPGADRLAWCLWCLLLGTITACQGTNAPPPPTANDAGNPASSLFVGGQPLSAADDARLVALQISPLYALGDVDGDERLTATDATATAAASTGADVACAAAADVDFDAHVTTDDVTFVRSVDGYNQLRLFWSTHLPCHAFSRVGGRNVGRPGDQVPIALLGDLTFGPDHNTFVRIVSGPGRAVLNDITGKTFSIVIDGAAQPGDQVVVAIDAGFEHYNAGAGRSSAAAISKQGRSYVIGITVQGTP